MLASPGNPRLPPGGFWENLENRFNGLSHLVGHHCRQAIFGKKLKNFKKQRNWKEKWIPKLQNIKTYINTNLTNRYNSPYRKFPLQPHSWSYLLHPKWI